MPATYKEDLGDREENDMPAAGIATSGPGTGSSHTGDAGELHTCYVGQGGYITVCQHSRKRVLVVC